MLRRNFNFALVTLMAASGVARAGSRALQLPSGPVVLQVTGKVRNGQQSTVASFDMAMLQSLPQVSHQAKTPWYAREHTFTGPLLREVLAVADAHGSQLRLHALNDYRTDFPLADALQHDVILARLLDGQPLSVREKGPLAVMYPFATKPELRTLTYFKRSIWQLQSIEVM